MPRKGQSKEFLRALRKKYGLGEFKTRRKGASSVASTGAKRTRARARAARAQAPKVGNASFL